MLGVYPEDFHGDVEDSSTWCLRFLYLGFGGFVLLNVGVDKLKV